MSVTHEELDPQRRAAQESGPVPVLRGAGTWSVTRLGIGTVLRLELRQRVRSSRWLVLLAVWFLLVGGLSALIRQASYAGISSTAGATMFGSIVFLVLSLGALISPALSATSINGDRSAGVLATMQSTLLSPAEIAIGKLLAAWVASLALLVTASPFLFWAYLEGGTPAGRLLTTLLLTAVTLLVVCAIGLGFSALTARTSSSTVLTYLTVAFLGLGLPLLFALTLPFVQQDESVRFREPVYDTAGEVTGACVTRTQVVERIRTERTWWLLAASPYVVVADAAPTPGTIDDPLSAIRQSVREARLGPTDSEDFCGPEAALQRQADRERLAPAWPAGLLADAALGTLMTVVAIRRLRTPTRNLPRGTRVA